MRSLLLVAIVATSLLQLCAAQSLNEVALNSTTVAPLNTSLPSAAPAAAALSPAELALSSADASPDFSAAGLFGSESSSFVMGTIGEYPSDTRMSGGGFGSLASAIGPSLESALLQQSLQYNDALATQAAFTAQPGSRQVAAGWRASLQPGLMYGLGVTAGQEAWSSLNSGTPVAIGGIPANQWPVAAAGATGSAAYAAPSAASAGFPAGATAAAAPATATGAPPAYVNPGATWSPYPASVYGAGHSDVLAAYSAANPTRPGYANPRTLDPFISYGSHAGLSSLAEYQSIAPLQGLAFQNAGGAAGWKQGIDSASATVISSRIDGVPQAIAGGRTTGRFGLGGGPFGFGGSQSVSAWAEVPDFSKLV